MNTQTYDLTSLNGNTIFAQTWVAAGEQKSVIILIHGLGEHSSRYNHWAERFTEKGYAVLSMDLQGHGKSGGKRGHVKSLEVILDDIDLLLDKAEELYPGYRKILYGHSMGGSLVLNHVIRRNKPLDALIVTSPWLKLTKEPPAPLLKLISVLKNIVPSLVISNQLNAEDISHDPEVVRDYRNDPLNHDRISVKMAYDLFDWGHYAFQNVYKINCPFLIMHGSADAITSSRASEEYVRNTNNRTHLKLWENQFHELHNEFIKDDVHSYIINWIEELKN